MVISFIRNGIDKKFWISHEQIEQTRQTFY